jgi:hypothetical protein
MWLPSPALAIGDERRCATLTHVLLFERSKLLINELAMRMPGHPSRLLLLASVLGVLSSVTACRSKCNSDSGLVLSFSPPLPGGNSSESGNIYAVTFQVNAKTYTFSCPTVGPTYPGGHGGRIFCVDDRVAFTSPDVDVESVDKVTVTIQAADGRFLAKDLVVQLGGVTETDPDGTPGVCTRSAVLKY